ncbi:magnesium/cobalt transporter CorA [Aneurinibacillus uraniidurans]|uniref:magnesium/cobalt transporter CorA n=1 Tax=Aneurinibacillus uraniidurans TaxID=2966586 RepID=UPI00234A7A2F|nr:magnesium/cobalt transporter CorA [Aneurinibacillus sp. B1]WCN37413.1 magnesium/cobalt transporter CorA [Aneurinibacillus sp. B1]
MITTLAITTTGELLENIPLSCLSASDIDWYWVDFNVPTEDEAKLLDTYFRFHPLAIEDCLHFLQRPKLDYYENYLFFVLHSLNQTTLDVEEVDMFVGPNFLVSFHLKPLHELDEVRRKFLASTSGRSSGPVYIAYLLIDKLVDYYFPSVYRIEDALSELDTDERHIPGRKLMDEVFAIRADLLKLRRTVGSMRDLLYRILNSERLKEFKEHHLYFTDIYDHLLRLAEMIDSSREMTADMRDNYISVNSYRMNNVMMVLTIISSIFIPLTFIAGVYGMNFKNMPELDWKYGYFAVLAVMAIIGGSMFLWFRRKGWLDMHK